MKTGYVLLVFAFVVFAGLINGCNDAIFPVAVVNDPDITTDPYLIFLEAESVYPASAPIGGEIVVRRGAGTFSAGFYRVTFSGGSVSEFFWPSSSAEVTITVAPNAISGPFGFTVGAAPDDGTYYGGPSADGFHAYAIKAPGLIVESDGNFSF